MTTYYYFSKIMITIKLLRCIMTLDEKIEIFRDTFNIDESIELSEDTVLNDLDNWDSMSKLDLSIIFHDYCNKKLTFEMIDSFKTLRDVFKAMD